MSQDTAKGASDNERLLSAARSDNEEMIQEIFASGDFDINFQDGLGNTALHYAASNGSTDVLEHILSHEECDVDLINRIEKATPLHLAFRIQHPDLKKHVIESLLDAGADTRIKDKNGETVLDLVPPSELEIKNIIYKARADASISRDDIADDDDEEDGSGSGSDDD